MKSALSFLLSVPFFALTSACSSSEPSADAGALDAQSDRSSDAPSDGKTDAPSDAGTCKLVSPYSSKNAVCNQCAESKCCIEINGCLGDPKCNDDYVNCILACALLPDDAGDAGTATCLGKCAKDFPQGKAAYDVAIGCAESTCATECK